MDLQGHGSQASPAEDQEPALRVRKVTGDVVFTLSRKEAQGLSNVKALRAEAGKAVSRRVEEVILIAGVQQLEDEDVLGTLLAEGTVQEVAMAIRQMPQFDPSADPLTQLPVLKWMLLSPQSEEQLKAAAIYRQLLSVERNPPINLVIEQGVVPRLLELCEAEDPPLQFEALWALTCVASGTSEQTRVVAEAGVPVFVRLLEASGVEVREQAVWALGNIAGDSTQLRDQVLQSGAMQPLLGLLSEGLHLRFLRLAVWTLSAFCRGSPPPDLALVAPVLKALAGTLVSTDAEVICDTAWGLSYVAEGSKEGVAAVLGLGPGVLSRCVELLAHRDRVVVTPTLRVVVNIISGGDDNQKQQVLSAGVLPQLKALMSGPRSIQLDSCRVVSKILAGNHAQIQEVLDAGLMLPLLRCLQGHHPEVRLEAGKAIENATSYGSTEQIRRFVEEGCVPAITAALPVPWAVQGVYNELGNALMNSLENVLEVGERLKEASGLEANPWVALVTGAEGLAFLERWAAGGCRKRARRLGAS